MSYYKSSALHLCSSWSTVRSISRPQRAYTGYVQCKGLENSILIKVLVVYVRLVVHYKEAAPLMLLVCLKDPANVYFYPFISCSLPGPSPTITLIILSASPTVKLCFGLFLQHRTQGIFTGS